MNVNDLEVKELLDIYKILLEYLEYLDTEKKKVEASKWKKTY